MYPDADLAEAERRLRMFLEQYWGGPTTYGEERGHPRLRMRHHSFAIDSIARDRWIEAMRAALTEQDLPPDDDMELWRYLLGSAYAMQNIMDDAPPEGAIDVTPSN
jgi:hemoglobin